MKKMENIPYTKYSYHTPLDNTFKFNKIFIYNRGYKPLCNMEYTTILGILSINNSPRISTVLTCFHVLLEVK